MNKEETLGYIRQIIYILTLPTTTRFVSDKRGRLADCYAVKNLLVLWRCGMLKHWRNGTYARRACMTKRRSIAFIQMYNKKRRKGELSGMDLIKEEFGEGEYED